MLRHFPESPLSQNPEHETLIPHPLSQDRTPQNLLKTPSCSTSVGPPGYENPQPSCKTPGPCVSCRRYSADVDFRCPLLLGSPRPSTRKTWVLRALGASTETLRLKTGFGFAYIYIYKKRLCHIIRAYIYICPYIYMYTYIS